MKQFLALLVALALLCGCASGAAAGDAKAPGANSALGQNASAAVPGEPGATSTADAPKFETPHSIRYGGIRTEVENTPITVGSKSFTVRWTNENDAEYAFGVNFRLEKKQGDSWVKVPFKDGDAAFISIAMLVAPGQSVTQNYSLELFDPKDVQPGTYRWVYDISNPEVSTPSGSYYNDALTAEFEIVAAA